MLAYHFIPPRGYFVPCRILERSPTGNRLRVRYTAPRGPYARGEVRTVEWSALAARPLRRSRQSPGRLYGVTIADLSSVPVNPELIS